MSKDKPKSGGRYQVKKKDGKGYTEVGKQAVDSAAARTGAFKPMSFKGSKTTSNGRTTSYKDPSGKVTHAKGPVESKALDKKHAYDYKVFKKDSTHNANRTERFKNATPAQRKKR